MVSNSVFRLQTRRFGTKSARYAQFTAHYGAPRRQTYRGGAMNAKSIRFATALLCAAAAWAQTAAGPSVSQVCHFTYSQAAIDIQQITSAIGPWGKLHRRPWIWAPKR